MSCKNVQFLSTFVGKQGPYSSICPNILDSILGFREDQYISASTWISNMCANSTQRLSNPANTVDENQKYVHQCIFAACLYLFDYLKLGARLTPEVSRTSWAYCLVFNFVQETLTLDDLKSLLPSIIVENSLPAFLLVSFIKLLKKCMMKRCWRGDGLVSIIIFVFNNWMQSISKIDVKLNCFYSMFMSENLISVQFQF